ncbi:hypothetical protein V6L76_08025 [Pannonibacter sp. Pt2]|uniref:Uncharacterized protein n=1 Tax=Pannonibacter anstelovis TaxID=3121537 RepID=A0ABU7ZME6_9HYPH
MAGILEPDPMPLAAAADTALLQRLAHVLQDMGLPCACQEEVERTIAIFTEFEIRRTRRRLLESARERTRQLAGFLPYLQDLESPGAAELDAADLAILADAFRQIAAAAAQGVASLELLAGMSPGTSRQDG